jgi:NAD(P)H-dependent FMN reductase
VLKNALDYAYDEWNNKPPPSSVTAASAAPRAVEQLRLHAVELQMAPIRNGVHIVWATMARRWLQGKSWRISSI